MFFCKVVLTILSSVYFHMNFRMSLSISQKKLLGFLLGLTFISKSIRERWHHNNIESYDSWTSYIYILSSLISLSSVLKMQCIVLTFLLDLSLFHVFMIFSMVLIFSNFNFYLFITSIQKYSWICISALYHTTLLNSLIVLIAFFFFRFHRIFYVDDHVICE